jgi:ribosome-binding factor A
MESTRQHKFSRLIQKEISDIFQKKGSDYYGNAFVTVTLVRTVPDLSLAKVYLSFFKAKEPGKIIDKLNSQAKDVRRELGASIKNQVRHIPELHFYLDDSMDYAENIDKILNKINIPPPSEEAD